MSLDRLEDRVLLHGEQLPSSLIPYIPAGQHLVRPGEFLTSARPGGPRDAALDFLSARAPLMGLTDADITNAVVKNQCTDRDTGVTHIYFRQTFNGFEITNANLNINLTADNRVINVGGGFMPRLGSPLHTAFALAPSVSAVEALQWAGADLGLASTSLPLVAASEAGSGHSLVLQASSLSLDPIPARLQYVATPGGLELAWNLVLRTPDGDHWYNVNVCASEGELLTASDWVHHASYNAFALPTESPDDGPRTIRTDPHDTTASPYGWHDINGAPGAEFTDTRGNNVSAQEDGDANNMDGFRLSGGASLNFNFPLDLTQDPSAYRSASIAQLFFLNNTLHDIHYRYGFTETAGNFQFNNYGRGGLGGDPVQADAHDGYDNANFATPPDGIAPRMQMYLWFTDWPLRDSALDNGIVIHEYGHGISNRLTGGPANSDALNALQSGGMGEGWSDWWALMLTQRATDTANLPRPIGNYALAEPPEGGGIRNYPYSYDMAVNPHTFGDYNESNQVHDAGELWASALWDMNWLLINRHGFNANMAAGYTGAGSAGNILALKLVMDALKLQPANPTFIEARDAILQADTVLTNGANQDLIWQAFARRGLGASASCGANANATTITEAFGVPPADPIVLRHDPTGTTRNSPRSIVFAFSEAMNTTSFSVASDVVSFTNPGGIDLKPQITGFNWVDSRTLRVNFTRQLTEGTYTMVIGPQILSADNGSAMDQDKDATPGESTQDLYTATLTYRLGYTASPTVLESIDLVAGATGVFSILDGVDDGTAAINLGSNTFNFYGQTYTGASSLYASDNGLLTFGAGDPNWLNSDLTSSPTPTAIAVLWQNWTTNVDANDRVLGKFQDINSDGINDRLIVEWNQVRLGYFMDTPSPVTFHAILQLNTGTTPGTIIINYPDLDTGESTFTEGNGTTAGIKDAGVQGDNRLLISYDDFFNPKPLVGTGKAILIEKEKLWSYEATAAAYESIDLVPGGAGVFPILDYYDDSTAGVDLGANTFTFYGIKYTGASSLFASSNGLLTFGSGHDSAGNTDLTFAPTQAAIAPLWDDWRTDLDYDDQVLGKFQDINNDGILDRLIIEWSRVRRYDTSPSDITFQAILQLNTGATPGAITFNYPDVETGNLYRNGADATVGIKSVGSQGDNRLLVSYLDGSNPLIGSNKAVRIAVATQSLSISDVTVTEGNSGTANASFTVTLSAPSTSTVTVAYATANGTALAPSDYTSTSGTLTFAPGETTKTITVPIIGDTRDEPDETFVVNLSNGVNATISDSQGVGTVVDNDPLAQLKISDVKLAEGQSGTKLFTFTVTLTGATDKTVQVDYATANGTAAAGSDYTATSGKLTFTPGQTSKTVSVTVTGDAAVEPDETFFVNLSSVINATIADSQGMGTITNDDTTLKVSDVSKAEGNSGTTSFAFTVSLSAAVAFPVTVQYTTANGTATAGSDYTALPLATLTFNPGETSKTVSVAITGDITAEPDETFFVNLSSATNATIADSQGKGTITNDEAMITINDVSKAEGNTGTTSFVFTVSLSAAMTFPVTVQYKTINGTATSGSDYTALPLATLTFNPGQTSKTVSVAVTGDTTVEPNEKFNVVLGTPTNAVIADGTGIGTILNDDVAALVPSSARETLRQANPARQQGAASLIDIAIERWSEWKSSEEVVLGWETAGLRHRGRYSRMLKRTPLSAAV